MAVLFRTTMGVTSAMEIPLKMRTWIIALVIAFVAIVGHAQSQRSYVPVTDAMLLNPPAEDWLMFSRTYDGQRLSPLQDVNRENVKQLRMVWSRGLPAGAQESIPLVHDGVMYLLTPGGGVQALDGETGDVLWEHVRPVGEKTTAQPRSKTLALFGDLVYYTSPDNFVVALDARTGGVRWQTEVPGGIPTSGVMVADGKVISGRSCVGLRAGCYLVAHDALTGKELWRFYTAAASGEPGGDTWADTPDERRVASTWGLPGTYDPQRRLLYWGVANPTPNTRFARHAGNADAIPLTAPADLYSNSTIALDIDTGRLRWYYQHLPGDDWDQDFAHERTLIRTRVAPAKDRVKWINPRLQGDERDIALTVGEPGGVFALDRGSGEFLWATPFPFDVPNFILSDIDVQTGKTHINSELLLRKRGDRHTICFYNTRSYWPTAYSARTNSLYVPWLDACLDMGFPEPRRGVVRQGSKPEELAGVAKIDASSGVIEHIYKSSVPINGAMLLTAGDLLFFGDLNRRFRALDAYTGKVLWETILGGPIAVSTITYRVNGKQFVAVMTGEGLPGVVAQVLSYAPQLRPPMGHNAVYVFALP